MESSIFISKQTIGKLTLILLMWRIWWAPNNTSKWQMGFNSAFEGLTVNLHILSLQMCEQRSSVPQHI